MEKLFRCIYCGQEREFEINPEDEKSANFSCSSCGFKMYEIPFDRESLLKREIIGFIDSLVYSKYEDDLEYEGKEIDDARFPSYEKIREYICDSRKTEEFCERIGQALEQYKKHVQTSFSNKYFVSYEAITEKLEDRDEDLKEVYKVLNIDLGIDTSNGLMAEIEWPKVTLEYAENPSCEYIDSVFSIMELLNQLGKKIKQFIVTNNIYGTAYQEEIAPSFNMSNEKDYGGDLLRCSEDLVNILRKKYEIDLLSDGSEELREMLKCLWNTMYVLMSVPVLKPSYRFVDSEKNQYSLVEFANKIISLISKRYEALYKTLYREKIFDSMTEDELFSLYKSMIEIDSYSYFGINSMNLKEVGLGEKKLNALVGLNSIKDSINKIKAYSIVNRGNEDLNIHMCFYGNPGTGKTEVARIIAEILYENKILPTKNVIEVDRSGLVGMFVGETPYKTMERVEEAMGGVLFIDEAYSLVQEHETYGHEAVATLIKAMEDYRGKFCVILAGYKQPMEKMIASNPGFKSRIQFELDFPNYSRDELGQIIKIMAKTRRYTLNVEAYEKMLDVTDVLRKSPDFANAREVRNMLEKVIMCQNLRCGGNGDKEIGIADVNKYIIDTRVDLPFSGEVVTNKILTGDDELEQLIGLESVKRVIKKVRAYAKRNKNDPNFNIHMSFVGNPGTGKTEVARILSRILFDAGVLQEAKLVETDASGLISSVVGETAVKTHAKVVESMGGVLFIDEAYGIVGSSDNHHTYGDEAISALLKDMEDKRGKFCVILAGYKDEMKKMFDTNPGFESRLQFVVEFPDYTKDELKEIASQYVAKKRYQITQDALEKILEIVEYYRKQPNFANARTTRNIIDQVIMNQNLRVEDEIDDFTIIISDVEDYLHDENINLLTTEKPKFGFAQ